MPVIDDALLDRICSTPREYLHPEPAFEACAALGALGRWWLADWVLQLAYSKKDAKTRFAAFVNPERPRFPSDPGSCWVVFLNKKRKERRKKRPMLDWACVLPLLWKKGEHSSHLPRKLLDVADQVVESLASVPGFNSRWGLHLANLEWFDQVCLHSDLRLGGSSAWAALAGGLVTLVENLQPQGTVWATGAWKKGSGIDRIDGLVKKLALAKKWKVKHFFVPESQAVFARKWVNEHAPDQMEIGILRRTAEPDPRATLNDYLAKLAAVPEDPVAGSPNEEQQFQKCRHWYLHQDTTAARDYYRHHLLPSVVRRCRQRYDKIPLSRPFTHFVTVVSNHNELAMINPLVVRAKRCLLLYHDLDTKARECQQWLKGRPNDVECELARFPVGTEMPFALAAAVARFTRGVPSDKVALDLTPGTKMMSYSLSLAAKPGNWLFCLQVDYPDERCPDGRPDPGSERPELLPVRY